MNYLTYENPLAPPTACLTQSCARLLHQTGLTCADVRPLVTKLIGADGEALASHLAFNRQSGDASAAGPATVVLVQAPETNFLRTVEDACAYLELRAEVCDQTFLWVDVLCLPESQVSSSRERNASSKHASEAYMPVVLAGSHEHVAEGLNALTPA